MKTKNIVSQDYWDNSYSGIAYKVIPADDSLRKLINEYISSATEGQTCLEIGCFPGRHLAVFGEMGYELHGIDRTPRIEIDLKDWFVKMGFLVGELKKAGIEQFNPDRKYDIVCSFGFIEHFTNWDEILQRHFKLVKDNGLIIITTPNFRGFFQRTFHKLVDKENFDRHVIDSMVPNKWKEIAERNGFSPLFHGHFGKYDFWVDNQKRGKLERKLVKFIRKLTPLFRKLPENKSAYSPYCGLIAKKTG